MSGFVGKVEQRAPGLCTYGLAPPRASTEPARLEEIVEQQRSRIGALGVDALIVYDIQDEAHRTEQPRPFPFLPTMSPESYAHELLKDVAVPKVVYRAVQRDTPSDFAAWLERAARWPEPRISVLVGAPSRRAQGSGLKLAEAYALARQAAPNMLIGGIAIAERHSKAFDEHERILAKAEQGCRFFVTQAVYDVTSTKSLLSDYALAVAARCRPAVPILLTFAPCGSPKTLEFMKWLGISFPRWLENELRSSSDILEKSMRLSEQIFSEVLDFAREKRLPVGINVESVSIRKAEIDASVELFRALSARMRKAASGGQPRTL